jgi:hypothetical protein
MLVSKIQTYLRDKMHIKNVIAKKTASLRKFFVKIQFIKICLFIQKLAWQNNGCDNNSLSGRDVVLLP